jgi:hypothetical protein
MQGRVIAEGDMVSSSEEYFVPGDVKKLYTRLQQLKSSKTELDSNMEHQILTSKGGVGQVNVSAMLNEKAIIFQENTVEEIKIEQQGPLSIVRSDRRRCPTDYSSAESTNCVLLKSGASGFLHGPFRRPEYSAPVAIPPFSCAVYP